jgi:hypothetical protein
VAITALCLAAGLFNHGYTMSAFSSTATNSPGAVQAGSVALTDNDSGSAMLSLTSAVPGDSDTGCIEITYTGTLPAIVRLHGTTTGSGLDAYLSLTITRGTVSSGTFDSCTTFSADATNYVGQGAGVVYSGTVQDFADSYAAGLGDPPTGPTEAWATNEKHAYKVQVTLQNDTSAQGKNATQSFTWEAHNIGGYAAAVLADSPAGYWRLGDAAGTTAAAAAGAATGTYTNGPVLQLAGGAGDLDTAVRFDGIDDRVVFGDVNDFAGGVPFSLEAWIRRGTDQTGWRYIVSKDSFAPSRNGWSLLVMDEWAPGEANKLGIDVFAGGSKQGLLSTTVTQPNTWYHVVATFDGTTFRMYVNGALENAWAPASPLSMPGNAAPVTVGDSAEGSTQFDGVIDEVAVYGTALSAGRVAAHYAAGR